MQRGVGKEKKDDDHPPCQNHRSQPQKSRSLHTLQRCLYLPSTPGEVVPSPFPHFPPLRSPSFPPPPLTFMLTRHCDDRLADGVSQVGLGSLLHLGQSVGADLTGGVPLTASLAQEVWR